MIEKTYVVSRQALHDQKYAVYAKLEAIRRDELPDCYDPEGGLPSLSELLDYELGQIESARQNLCQAVLVMLYHFWEKQVLGWAGNLKGNDRHKSYVEYCASVGPTINESRLEQLRCITNLVKHGQGVSAWGDRLHKLNSSLFPKAANTNNPLDYLHLSDEYVENTFQAVKDSGPGAQSDFKPIISS